MLTRMSIRPARCLVAVLALLALGAGACSSGSSKATPTTVGRSTTTTTPTTAKAPAPIRHVFVINLENESYVDTWAPASPAAYLNKTLRPQGQLLTQYFCI